MQPPTIYKPGKLGYLWNYLGSSLKSFAAALSPYMGGGDAGVKKYVALLRQDSSSNTITSTVLENSIGGNPTWSDLGPGEFQLTFDTPFDINKTYCSSTLTYNQNCYFSFINVNISNSNIIDFWTYNTSSPTNMYSDLNVGAYIEIRVYP